MTPKHRRPTRPDRLLLWAKDRLTAFALRHDVKRRRVVEPVSSIDERVAAVTAECLDDGWSYLGTNYHPTEYAGVVNTLADVRLQTAGGRDFQIWDMEVQA